MQNKFGLKIYPKAEQDMETIFEYISQQLHTENAALKLINMFYERLENVRMFPESCPTTKNDVIKDKTLRKLIVEKYIIYYKPNMTTSTIEVVRVIYGMMNLEAIL